MRVVQNPVDEMPMKFVDEKELDSHHYVIKGRYQKGLVVLFQPVKIGNEWNLLEIGTNRGLHNVDGWVYKYKTLKECLDYFCNPHGQYEVHCFRSVKGFLKFCFENTNPLPCDSHYELTDGLDTATSQSK